ncbi:MAG: hypothetical protein KC912_09110 [Proteobacteria bacterium]|nr:hypothetical protein [Pseudomonadota bacterium]
MTMLLLLFSAWMNTASAQGLGDFLSPGELSSAHADLTGITQCTSCHEVGSGVSAALCMDCHDRVEEQVRTKTGFHADKGATCHSCHPDHRGADFDMVNFEEEEQEVFDHDSTGFRLEGEHGEIECSDCHEEPDVWTGLEQTCMNCHEDPHGAVKSDRALLQSCDTCHEVKEDWPALPLDLKVFDHTQSEQVDFVLEGEHVEVGCEDCHEDWTFVPVESGECEDCHDNIHGDQFAPKACEDCHDVHTADFALRKFSHRASHYPLKGVHRKVSCEACHGDGEAAIYKPLPHAECSSCHADPHEGQFAPRDCDACHSEFLPDFALSGFDHDQTDFPLQRDHAKVGCDECHGDGPASTFASLPFDGCDTCHDDEHEGRFDPSPCAECHLDGTWDVEDFDHGRTAFSLKGKHSEVECESCHYPEGLEHTATQAAAVAQEAALFNLGRTQQEGWVWHPVEHESCNDCHAKDEPHNGKLAADTCDDCHATTDWVDVRFDHASETEFALDGSHTDVGCNDCHSDPAFEGQKTACESCHVDDSPPEHFGETCGECHQTAGWMPANLGPLGHEVTGYGLHGAHETVTCVACHGTGKPMSAAPRECESCHADEDPHRNLLGSDCSTCHGEVDWLRTSFRHASTGFSLRGAHRMAACNDCHAAGYIGTPQDCVSCHLRDFEPGEHRDPNDLRCEGCHQPYDWERTFNPHRASP